MCVSHQTRQWGTYSTERREVADQIVFPWKVLTDRCLGPHLSTGPTGSYSLLENDAAPPDADRVVKVFIMESSERLPDGVYIGLRSHMAGGGIGQRTQKENRLWDPAFVDTDLNAAYFNLMDPAVNTIGLTPKHHVCFSYFQVQENPSDDYLIGLCRFIERCRLQYE